MRTLELRTADGRSVARRVHMACSFRSRCVGLLRHRGMPEHEGMLLVPCGTIHTLGMRFAIDVVFLNAQMRVLGVAERVPPWRVVIAPRGTARVLELAAGRIETARLTVGTYLIVECALADPSERTTARLRRDVPCERSPIQFSLRLPADRLRTPQPCQRAPGARATTPPSVET